MMRAGRDAGEWQSSAKLLLLLAMSNLSLDIAETPSQAEAMEEQAPRHVDMKRSTASRKRTTMTYAPAGFEFASDPEALYASPCGPSGATATPSQVEVMEQASSPQRR